MLEKQAAEGALFLLYKFSVLSVEVHQDVEPEMLENANTDFRAYSSFIPTKYHFNRPPECKKDKSNSSTMKLFSHLVNKAGGLGRKRRRRRRAWRGRLEYCRGDKVQTFSGCTLSAFWRAPERVWSVVGLGSLAEDGFTPAKTAMSILYHCDCCFVQRSCTVCTLAAAQTSIISQAAKLLPVQT